MLLFFSAHLLLWCREVLGGFFCLVFQAKQEHMSESNSRCTLFFLTLTRYIYCNPHNRKTSLSGNNRCSCCSKNYWFTEFNLNQSARGTFYDVREDQPSVHKNKNHTAGCWLNARLPNVLYIQHQKHLCNKNLCKWDTFNSKCVVILYIIQL